MKQKNKKMDFLGLLGTLRASLLRNLLTDRGTIWPDEGAIRAGKDFYPLTNFEMHKYHPRNNFPKIPNLTCLIYLDKYKLSGTHWIAYM